MPVSISISAGLAYSADEDIPAIQRMTVRDAAYHTVYRYQGGVQALADRMGVPKSTLEKKVGAGTPQYQLKESEIMDLVRLTGDKMILQVMCHAAGGVYCDAIPDQSEGDPIEAFAEQHSAQGEFSKQVAWSIKRQPPSRSDMRRLDEYAGDLINKTLHLVCVMRTLMRPAPKSE